MINGLSQYSSVFNNNAGSAPLASSSVEGIIEEHKKNVNAEAPNTNSAQTNIHLSSKAQKIQMISTEFFGGSGPNFNQLEQLKARVYQAGLISKEEYAQLTKQPLSNDELSKTHEKSTLGITDYIDDLVTRLNKNDKDNAQTESKTITELKLTLSSAKTIISDIDNAKTSTTFQEELAKIKSFLNDTIRAEEFSALPLDDQIGLTKVHQTLEIVDNITPKRLTNNKLNQYLAHAL